MRYAPGQEPKSELFATAAAHLRNLADALDLLPVEGEPPAAPGSRAAVDADDTSFDGVWGRPTFELLHEPALRLVLAVEHVRGLAALTEADRVTVALASMVRPALTTISHLHYLYDPAIDVRERVRRRYNLRLVSLVEKFNLAAAISPEARASVARSILEVKSSAATFGFHYKPQTKRRDTVLHTRYLERRMPSEAALISAVVDDSGDGDLGRTLHRITSAVVHGQAHGLSAFILASHPTAVPGVAMAQIGISSRMFVALTGSVVFAANTAVSRVIDHFGWPLEPWSTAVGPVLTTWGQWILETRGTTSQED